MPTSFLRLFVNVLVALFLSLFSTNVFAQSAEVRSMGVYYVDSADIPKAKLDDSSITATATNVNSIYCNWGGDNLTKIENIKDTSDNPKYGVYKGGIVNVAGKNTSDPWQTSALIEYDQPYPSPTENNSYPNHCLGLCMDVYCTNKPNGSATYSVAFPIQNVRFEIAKYYASNDIGNPEKSPAVRTIDMSMENNYIVNGNNVSNGNIDLSQFMCASYSCWGSSASFYNTQTCPNPLYECVKRSELSSLGYKNLCTNITGENATDNNDRDYCCRPLATSGNFNLTPSIVSSSSFSVGGNIYCGKETRCSSSSGSGCANGRESLCIIRSAGTGKGYNDPIRFCTSWDGSYEILGEFGKTNGQFGVRGTIHTDYPGDG
ncbi:MAG: hypothetical protein IKL48_05990, partial [Elusimicrobiaceae bacterium]|nr:hypothetical protein [Elusimicrobiaceae bacterium]